MCKTEYAEGGAKLRHPPKIGLRFVTLSFLANTYTSSYSNIDITVTQIIVSNSSVFAFWASTNQFLVFLVNS